MQSDLCIQTTETVRKVQQFDESKLIRRAELGDLSFDAAISPARKLIDLFNQIPVEYLEVLPDQKLGIINNAGGWVLDQFQLIQDFSLRQSEPENQRNQIIATLTDSYSTIFEQLHWCIAYLSTKNSDIGLVKKNATAVFEEIRRQTQDVTTQLNANKIEADTTLKAIREVAAEQGVSQQAVYFKSEANLHQEQTKKWQKRTISMAVALTSYSIGSVFLFNIDALKPETFYESAHLALSKFLIFGVIAYMLILCARNFMSHKHNEIVNRHRQNALLTFKSLAEASNGEGQRDIVLSYAAACIFAPQETGYTKSSNSNDGSPLKIIEMVQKATHQSN